MVLPAITNFETLVLVFALPFICAGTLVPRPSFCLVASIVAFNGSAFLNLQSPYDADLQDAFRDVRTALTTLDPQGERDCLPLQPRGEVDRVLSAVQLHFKACATRRRRLALAAQLLRSIDAAIATAGIAATQGMPTASLHALVLLTVSLAPDMAAGPDALSGATAPA